ncbi:MAG TPA: hypothetical protein VJ771_06070 [Candidatus Nitrosotalea sp.]|nr:hypothetical protein [Candidatus Nitrosotalea sp.]
MKTRHISIIFISIISGIVLVNTNLAYAEQPLLDFYNNSQLVLVGKVLSLSQVPTTTSNPSQSPNQTRYDVQVEDYYKNPQSAKIITVYGYAKGIYFGQDPTFNVSDRVFLYLNQENGYYQIQSPSFTLENDCDARTMVPMPTLPFEPPPISSPALEPIFEFESATGTRSYTFGVGDKIHINFVAENYMPVIKYATLNFVIKTENDTNLVFNNTQQITIPACNGNVPVSWDFVPQISGTYFVHVNMSDSIPLGSQLLLFNESSSGSSFDVRQNTSGLSIDRAEYLPSPLKQLKSGVAPKDVKCNGDLQLVFKAEDSFPACVKINTAFHLAALGWGYLPSPFVTKTDFLNSTISGGTINEFQYDLQSASIIIKIQTVSNGTLNITIPKIVTDLNPLHKPFKDFHTVLVDGMEENVALVPTENGSSFAIPFENGTQEIEIIGNQVGFQG